MSTNKIASLELGRVIAIFAVITIHSQLFVAYPLLNGEAWFGHIINQLCRFAVPFFFILSGFLIQPKLKASPIKTATRYCKPILLIWLVWSLIYLAAPFNLATLMNEGYLVERERYWGFLLQTPLNSFLEGGLVHLWYLLSLIIGLGIIALILRLGLDKWLLPLSLLVFIYGVLAGSYSVLTHMEAPFLTRNGPFLSLLMISLGYWIREKKLTVSANAALVVFLVGGILHLAEAYMLTGFGMDFRLNDFLFTTPIWALGFFFYLLAKPSLGEHPMVFRLASMTLGIYVSHLLFTIYMNNLAGMLGLEHFAKDALIWCGTVVLAFLFTWAVGKTPLAKILLR